MQIFKYSAISENGKKVTGQIEAFDEYEAVNKMKADGLVITNIKPVKARNFNLTENIFKSKKIKEKSLSMVCSQFSIILGAGLPIVRTVELIANQTADKTLKKILVQVVQDVSNGFSLTQSFENRGNILPTTFIETVRSGEKSGTLDKSFHRLHDHYAKSSKIKAKVRGALTYPVFTLIVAVIVIAVIMIVAVPTFTTTFNTLGTEMPLPTKILIGASTFLSKYWIIFLAVILAVFFGIQIYGRQEKGRQNLAKIRLKIPVIGKVIRMKTAAQFANTMATLLTAGLPIISAVTTTGRVLDNYYIGWQIINLESQLETGRHLGNCLKQCKELPDMLVEMTGMGEESGMMESTLEIIGAYYDNETEMASEKALTLLEPIVICILALFVALIMLAIYLPMLSMYGSIQ